MTSPEHHAGTYEESVRLARRVRRNRRRTLRILTGAVLTTILWPLYIEYRTRQTVAPRVQYSKPVIGTRFPPRPASPDAKTKLVYPYSVIPGGVYSGAALARAIARDPILAAHYAGFKVTAARLVPASRGLRLYASYRVGDRIFWTGKPIALHEGEALLTDGVHLVRARCGNRLATSPRLPVGPSVELDSPEIDESKSQWRDSDPEDRVALPDAAYSPVQLAPNLFPDVFVDQDGRLTTGATAAAAHADDTRGVSDANESLSGYTNPKPAIAREESFSWAGRALSPGVGPNGPVATRSNVESGTGAGFVVLPFSGSGTSSGFKDSWPADLLPWPAIVPTAAASVWTAEPTRVDPVAPSHSYSPPPQSPPETSFGSGLSGWGPFNLIVSGIAVAERGVSAPTDDEEGGGSGAPTGGGLVTRRGFSDTFTTGDGASITASIPEPDSVALIGLGLVLLLLWRFKTVEWKYERAEGSRRGRGEQARRNRS